MSFKNVEYIPILGLKPAEMAALEELPEKDKDNLLPLISLKKWANSGSLEKSFQRINKAFGQRRVILDLDKEFFKDCQEKDDVVSKEFLELCNPNEGYKNWVNLFKQYPHYIPVLQINTVHELEPELEGLIALNRPIVLRLELGLKLDKKREIEYFIEALKVLISMKDLIKNLLIILDYGDFSRKDLINYQKYIEIIEWFIKIFPAANFCISGTSFPYSFAGSYRGEIPIYERQIYNKIRKSLEKINLIYSDRGSTRSNKMGGGGQRPPPRVDYPLKNDWRFIRKEDEDYEARYLYEEACIEIVKNEYWNKDLHVWGTQMIEKTSLRDPYGIGSPQKATAVRINIHLYLQLHYFDDINNLDTDDDWED